MNLFKGIDQFSLGGISEFLKNVIQYAMGIIGIVCVIFIIVGGIQLITSAGNQEQAVKAKASLTWAVVGLILVLGAYFIINNFVSIIKGQ